MKSLHEAVILAMIHNNEAYGFVTIICLGGEGI